MKDLNKLMEEKTIQPNFSEMKQRKGMVKKEGKRADIFGAANTVNRIEEEQEMSV